MGESGDWNVAAPCVAFCLSTLFATSTLSAEPTGKHFVWRVTNAAAPIYLVGTLHAPRGNDYPLPGVIEQAIRAPSRVLFEMDPNAREAPLLNRRLNAAGEYPRGVVIDQKIKPTTLARLKRIASIPYAEYEHRRPWSLAYFNLRNRNAVGFNLRLSMDSYIYNRVRGRARLGGLETADEFVSSFTRMSDAESEAYLLDSIRYSHLSPQLLIDTSEAWKRGDTGRMYGLYARGASTAGYWRWLVKRQRVWLPRIEAAIKSGQPVTVVAGALHFCGPRSLLALLQERGYRMEQL